MLEIEDLVVEFGRRRVVDHVSVTVPDAARHALIGESGSGKSLTLLTILGLTPPGARVSGSIRWRGQELVGLPEHALARIRGKSIGTVFQDPLTALDPVRTIGRQVTDALRHHYDLTRAELRERALDILAKVRLDDPEAYLRRYPHQLSGGQRQRVAIAAAVISGPRLILADEPTTALDVTVQAGVLEVFRDLVTEAGASLLFVTHDLALLPLVATAATVLDEGRVVEQAPVATLLTRPAHPATQALLAAARATNWVDETEAVDETEGTDVSEEAGTLTVVGLAEAAHLVEGAGVAAALPEGVAA